MMDATDPGKPLYRAVGDRIRSQRRLRDLTQQQLGDMVDVTRATIANIEGAHQRVSLDLLFDIADALGTNVYLLLPSNYEV